MPHANICYPRRPFSLFIYVDNGVMHGVTVSKIRRLVTDVLKVQLLIISIVKSIIIIGTFTFKITYIIHNTTVNNSLKIKLYMESIIALFLTFCNIVIAFSNKIMLSFACTAAQRHSP